MDRPIADVVDGTDAAADAASDRPRPPEAGIDTGAPLSYSQRRLWFLDRFAPGSHAYNVPLPLRIEGPLAPAVLAAALGEIVRRHEVLRTTYAAGEQDPWQVVHPAGGFALPLLDLSGLPERHRRAEAQRLLEADAVRPFDLLAGPVLRTSLLRLRAEEHLLLFNVHHIAFDGWSTAILRQELAVLYGAAAAGRTSPLPELPWQYSDFAAWQRRWLAGEDVAAQLAFWRRTLAGAPDLLEIPADRPRPPAQSFRGETLQSHLPAAETATLGALARERGATLFMLMLAAFQTLLHRYTGQDDLLVGTPVAGRERRETQGLIGFFVNTLALRADLAGDPAFGELLARTRDLCLAAYSHQELPFERLVEELQPVRDLSRPPLVQVLLAMENARRQVPQPSGLRFIPLEAEIRAAKLDLTLIVQEWDPVLALSCEYALDLFEPATIERLAAHLRSLLAAAVAFPGRRLSELPLLSPAERAQALKQAGVPGAPFLWEGGVHQRFAAWAREAPGAVAVVHEGESLTYGELDARAGLLARRLRRLGVGPESRVGLFCERSLSLVTAILGVLKAGGAYVPLDPNYPADRVAFVLADAGAGVVLTQAALADRLPATTASVLRLDEPGEDEDREPLPAVEIHPDNAAYVIYTSGSTGMPKGVVISHREVARLMAATDGWYGFGPDDVWTLFHSYAFDFSVWEIWGALAHGGRLVVVPWWVSREPGAFLALLASEGVTVLNQTPSAFRQLVLAESGGPVRDLALRLVIFGGEALEMASLAPWFARHGDERPRLVNMYGITETTVHVTYRPVAAVDVKAASVIGVPIPDLQVHVLEPALGPGSEPAPLLVPGEIHVGGAGLARGYLNRPELTAERFVPDPFGGRPGARLYRSGDLARRLPGGDLAYLGRIDQQVKIRGFRIELGEVEAALSSLPGVSEAVVLALPDPAGGSRLVACVAGAGVPASQELRAQLKQRLPEHMVPAGFVVLPSLPLTANGKVDRKALARLEPASGRDAAVTAPRTPAEQALAKIFAERLAAGAVGLESNFFDLGGHSLLAVRMIADIRQVLGIELTVRTLFEAPTVASLARAVETAREGGAGAAAAPAFTAVSRAAGRLPLSYSQRRLWFLDQFTPGSHAYNLLFPLRFAGELDPAALAAALSEIVRRHEVLRTTYTAGERDPWQVVQPAEVLPLPLVDLAALPAESRRQESLRLAAASAVRPFDLRAGPVFRASLVRLAAAEHVLLLGVHHIAFDGWSVGLLLAELAALYGAAAAGRPSPLPELPWQYADFAAWQRSTLSGEALAAQ
ncbi:MAG TPA: amino acid adenylation domain-containing protein, partial [Thermoanaerobaculia bacterium]|nr:amino acid adenylation domain-containing protein [Thermoanaerobaculia bacterium]